MQKKEQYKNIVKFGLNLFIWLTHIGIWAFLWMRDYADTILRPFGYKGNWLVFAVYGIISLFFTKVYGGYRIGYYRRDNMILSGIISVFFTNILTYLQICLIGRGIMRVLPFILMTVADILTFSIWVIGACSIYIKIFPPHKMLMVYGGDTLAVSLIKKMASRTEKYHIQEALSISCSASEVMEKILAYSSVILCDVPAEMRNDLIKFCFEHDIRAYMTPKISDILVRSAEDITLFDTPLLLNRNSGLNLEQRFLKRTMDIAFAVIMLILLSPFMLITAVLIKLQDGGSVIYKQERLTQNGRKFFVYKFRSMVVGAEKESGIILSTQNDARITKVGNIIRKIRMDELPQIWNILIGDMSIVGPRPERPELTDLHAGNMSEFTYRLKVRAGLTGYAQVFGKYNTTAYDKLRMDLIYISGYSLSMDLKIMLMTFKILFQKESTEGISEKSEQQ